MFNNSSSFTLIELMTVVAIVAILSGITLIGFNLFLKQGKIAKSMAFDSSIHFNLGYAIKGDWKMDDNAANSTVVDTSGYNNDGTFHDSTNPNTSYHSVDGANGTALEFDGVDDYVDVNNTLIDSLTGYTISLWAKSNGMPHVYNMPASAYNGHYWYLDHHDNDKWHYKWKAADDASYNIYSDNTVAEGQWYYIVVTNDGSNQYMYVNGVQQSGTITANGFDETSLSVLIGGYGNHHFDGSIDQVRIYSEAFSLSQVKYQYYTGLQRLYDKGLMSGKEYKSRIVKLNSES